MEEEFKSQDLKEMEDELSEYLDADMTSAPTPAKRTKLEGDGSSSNSPNEFSVTDPTPFQGLKTPEGRTYVPEELRTAQTSPSPNIMNLKPLMYASGIQSYLEASFSGTNNDSQPEPLKELDWVWDEESKSVACCLSKRKSEVKFHMDYSCGTATARSTEGFKDGQIYWEIKMVSPVYGTDMMIGIGTEKIQLDQYMTHFCSMLGLDLQGESCGLSYSGHFYHGGSKSHYCNKFGQSTVIGIHLDLWTGSLTYYKNGKCLGVACSGLNGKQWFPMVSSTAARSSMRLIRTEYFPSSLQFLCCKQLRQSVPSGLNVLDVIKMPPGLKIFLKNNLSWLLDPLKPSEENGMKTQGTQTLLSLGARKAKLANPTKPSGRKRKKD